MTFAIPKALKSLNSLITETVIPVELNDTDVDRMMTHIMEIVVKQGRRAPSKTDVKAYDDYLDRLQANPALSGFEGDAGRRVLDGWLRASVLHFERAGLRRSERKMGFLEPLTIASYRSGLPKMTSRNRRADQLAYRSMLRCVAQRGGTNPKAHVNDLFQQTFGTGVDLGQFPHSTPAYDGTTDVDITTLLSLRFLEAFEPNKNPRELQVEAPVPVPWAEDSLGTDLVDFLTRFGPVMPVGEAFVHLSALLSLRLFQLPLVTGRAVRALFEGNAEPPQGNPAELYCDFVGRRGSESDELSRACVRRDLQIMATLFADRLLLRSIGQAVELAPELRPPADDGWTQLIGLAEVVDRPQVQMALGLQIQAIAAELEGDDRAFLDEVRQSGLSNSEQLTALLVEGLRKRGLENQIKWFWSTGGINKSYGVLAGTLKARTTWRYAPTDECLTALLCMAFLEPNGSVRRELPVRDVLLRLRRRFGLLISEPPEEFDSADARSGAAENLAAFTRRLQLLGCFEGLSDDFDAQVVRLPREVRA